MSPIPRDKVRFCAGCRQERHVTHFIPDSPYCELCREMGPHYPQEPRGRVAGGKGKTMTEKGARTECPWCHAMKSNLWEHKKRCKKRPPDAGADPGTQPGPKASRPRKARAAMRLRTAVPAVNRCLFCDGAPNAALAKDLATRMIRNGMTFDAAADLTRDVVGMLGTRTERG